MRRISSTMRSCSAGQGLAEAHEFKRLEVLRFLWVETIVPHYQTLPGWECTIVLNLHLAPVLPLAIFHRIILGENTDASKSMFNIPGLSLVYHHETGKEKGFLGGSFGISMTRTNDLNRKFNYVVQTVKTR